MVKNDFIKLNDGWDAEPNAPGLNIVLNNNDVVIVFLLDDEVTKLQIVFSNCFQYRIGKPNMDDFYLRKSKFNQYGIEWGNFYLINNSNWREEFPEAIKVGGNDRDLKHFIYYFRDETFECIASSYNVEMIKI